MKIVKKPIKPVSFKDIKRGELFRCDVNADIYIRTEKFNSVCNCVNLSDGGGGLMYDNNVCYKVDAELVIYN